MSGELLRVQQISKQIGTVNLLCPIDLTIKAGEFITLLGPNGSGKTTFFRLCAGMYQPSSGDVEYNSISLRDDPVGVKRLFGYCHDINTLPISLTGQQLIELSLQSLGRLSASEVFLKIHDLYALDDFKYDLISTYSSGMKQKLAISLSFLNDPGLVFLDEALNFLDPVARYETRQFLHQFVQNGKSVILATHDVTTIASCSSRIILIAKGKIVQEWAGKVLLKLQGNFSVLEQEIVKAMKMVM